MKTALLSFLVAFLFISTACASIVEEGFGIVYGVDHAFGIKAPKGWMLDNQSAAHQGVHAVFYPKGSNWNNGAIVAYARSRPKTDNIKTADDAAKAVVEDFHANGNPNSVAKRIKAIKTDTGKEAVIYYFKGDQWGNSEAVVYFVENKTINFIVLTTRDPKLFADSLGSFEALAKSYMFMGDHPIDDTTLMSEKQPIKKSELFADVHTRAHEMGETKEGKAYEKLFTKAVAKPLQAALNEYTKDTKPPYSVNIVFMIAADGMVQRILPAPEQPVSARIAKLLNGLKVPVPPKPGWLVAMNIEIN